MSTSSKPNILLIMSDQHNKHITGRYGDPVVRTPNIDALASTGVTFTDAYCPFPLCAPARMSFMTGREPYELKAWDNYYVLPSNVPTFAHALGAASYEVILCGRMHFNGPDQRHGFQARIFPEVSTNAAGQLVRTNEFRRTSFEISGPGRNHYLLYDEQCTAAAIHWLTTRAKYARGQRPFCLVVGMVGPHCPFVCPRNLYDYYRGVIKVPRYSESYFNSQHPYVKRFRHRSRLDTLTNEEIQRTRAAYYGMIEFDDQLIGGLTHALSDTGIADDTVVIYTSDHGDMAGEPGLWWKMSFYEGSAGIPMIVSWPGHFREKHVEHFPVSLIDLAPTLTAIGGGPAISGITGLNLFGLLTGNDTLPDRPVFSELWYDPEPRIDQGPLGGPGRMMRRGDWKCNIYHNEPTELFNLVDDPDEMVNRAGDPACGDVLEDMITELRRDWNPVAVAAEARAQSEMRTDIQNAPGDQSIIKDEYWVGPDNYGCIESFRENHSG